MPQIGDIARITKLRSRPKKRKSKKGTARVEKRRYLTATDAGRELTREQEQVVMLPPEARALVTAGPGTGKTHVLIARLEALVNEHGLLPGREVLVLSFSRAAVGEIRKRVKEAGGDVRYVRAMTFDSFATRLLMRADPTGDWVGRGYDGRIARATDEIRTNPKAVEMMGSYAHILVDEIQDLVEVRGDLLKAVLTAATGGFTLMGDPAQGIYGWQVQDAYARAGGSQILYRYLRSNYATEIQEFELTKNHRVQTKAAGAALGAGAKLNQAKPDYRGVAEALTALVEGLPRIEELTSELPGLLNDGQSTAILCRNNAQALVIARELAQAGISHSFQRASTARVVAPWIGTVLGAWQYGQIGRSAFIDLFHNSVNGQGPEAEEAWLLLKRLEGQQGNGLDIAEVRAQIARGNVPDELNLLNAGQLTISTIHRAKGLEFDRVVLVEPDINMHSDQADLAEETRVLYVALTRPRRELLQVEPPDTRNMRPLGNDERWAKRIKGWQLLSVELRGEDVHSQDPAGGYLVKGCDAAETQAYLKEEVRPGDAVTLELHSKSTTGQPRAFYRVKHNGRTIGITSERFADAFHSVIKVHRGWSVRWPEGITEARVEAVDTVAGTVAAGRNAGLNETGIWLRARVAGLGAIQW